MRDETDSGQRGAGGSLLRAALLGLCGGLLLGGAVLVFHGLKALLGPADCAGLSEPECNLLQQTLREVGRLQTVAGGALIALAFALAVLLRPRAPGGEEGEEPPSEQASR